LTDRSVKKRHCGGDCHEVAVIKSSSHLGADHRFVTTLIRTKAQNELVKFGFGRKPKQ
jgi:hypothetical protein